MLLLHQRQRGRESCYLPLLPDHDPLRSIRKRIFIFHTCLASYREHHHHV
jgi:hypothetical protein